MASGHHPQKILDYLHVWRTLLSHPHFCDCLHWPYSSIILINLVVQVNSILIKSHIPEFLLDLSQKNKNMVKKEKYCSKGSLFRYQADISLNVTKMLCNIKLDLHSTLQNHALCVKRGPPVLNPVVCWIVQKGAGPTAHHRFLCMLVTRMLWLTGMIVIFYHALPAVCCTEWIMTFLFGLM